MKKIITQLQEIVNRFDGRWSKIDFEYDTESLKRNKGAFLWMVRKDGTSLVCMESITNPENYSNSRNRMSVFRNPDWHILSMKYATDAEYYYYDGTVLKEVDLEEVEQIYYDVFTPFLIELQAKYHEEYIKREIPLDIVYSSEESRERMTECLRYANRIGDTTLLGCIERLSHWVRLSIDHKVQISLDFDPKSFFFQEIIDGIPNIAGGIIFHQERDKSYWMIHT